MKFVFDLDGTICFQGRAISQTILDCLAQLTSQGHEVIFASARPIRDMLPVIGDDFHHYTMIGGNGSIISQQGKLIHSTAFPLEQVTHITELIEEFDATYLIDGDWNYAYTGPNNHPILNNLDPGRLANKVSLDSLPSLVKILILTSKDNELLAEKLSELDVYVNKHGDEEVFDISPKGIHKWSALETLGIKRGEYIAFGNDSNDITMFEHALHSVMIGWHEQLALLADESIDDDENLEKQIVEKIETLSKNTQALSYSWPVNK